MALTTMVFGEHCRLCRGYQTLEVFNGAFSSSCWGLEQWAVGARARGVHTLRVHFQCPGSVKGQLQRCMSWWRPEQAEMVGANCRFTRSSGGSVCLCAVLWLLSLIPGTWQQRPVPEIRRVCADIQLERLNTEEPRCTDQ